MVGYDAAIFVSFLSLPNGAVGSSVSYDVAIFVFFCLFLTVPWVGLWAVMLLFLFFSVSSKRCRGLVCGL